MTGSWLDDFDHIANLPESAAGLRKLLLTLAAQGKLSRPAEGDDCVATLCGDVESRTAGSGRGGTLSNGSNGKVPEQDLPPHWQWRPFSDVAVIESNLVSPRDYLDHPHVAPNHIEKETGRLLEYGTVRGDKVTSNKHLFFPGQIIYSKIRPNLNKVTVVDFEGLCSADMYPVRALIDTGYLHKYMLAEPFLQQVINSDNRLAMPKVNQQQLSAVWVAVPPLAEQKRIVAKVDKLLALCDELEARQEKKAQISVQLNKAVLHAVVSAPDPKTLRKSWKRIEDNFDLLYDRIKNVEDLRQAVIGLALSGRLYAREEGSRPAAELLREILAQRVEFVEAGDVKPLTAAWCPPQEALPRDWVWTRLAAVLIYGPRNGLSPKGVERPTDVRVLTLSATTSGAFDPRHWKYVDVDVPKDSHLWLEKGDLLLQRSNTLDYVGTMAVVTTDDRFIYPDLMMRMKTSPLVSSGFLHLAVNGPASREYIRSIASGTSSSMPKVNQKTISDLPIPLPPLAEQQEILARVQRLMALCDNLEAKLKQADEDGERLMRAVVESLVA